MNIDQTAFNLIATSMARHFDSVYYIEIETDDYIEFIHSNLMSKLKIPPEGKDFFTTARNNAHKYVHPDDLENVLRIHTKEVILENLKQTNSYSIGCRIIVDGKVVHIRHVDIKCDDNKHMLCCIENIEAEFQEKEEKERALQSAERMARRDELTGIKNKNALTEYKQTIEEKIKSGAKDFKFGIVMCDLNDLKLINDTHGHSFGDEALQRTSHMICEFFKHSPVFRIGGDEFIVILNECDYKNRDKLLKQLRDESLLNKKSRTGPIVASGLAVYDPETDKDFCSVFSRADQDMYLNKNELKNQEIIDSIRELETLEKTIPDDRKRMLDRLFGALYTIAGESYIYLNDMHYDYSRWSLPLVNDFGLKSNYMYHADQIWQDYIHPDDLELYRDAVDSALCGNAELKQLYYRAKKLNGTYVLLTTRCFVLTDNEGNPDYFGGIILLQ